MDSRFAGKKILLLDGLTSQCLEYTKAFNGLGCDTTVLCDDRFDTCYASKHPKHKILGVSNVRDLKGTEEWILKLVKSGEYDVVIPFTEYSATILSHHKKELSTYAHLIVNDQDVFDYAQDKNNVMKVCMENDLPCPMTIYDAKSVDDILASNIKFPIILKPSHGFGSHGFHKIGTKEELAACVEKFDIDVSEMVVQEYIPQEGLNVADNLFVDKEGNTKSAFTYASYRFYPIDGFVLNRFGDLINHIQSICERRTRIPVLYCCIGVTSSAYRSSIICCAVLIPDKKPSFAQAIGLRFTSSTLGVSSRASIIISTPTGPCSPIFFTSCVEISWISLRSIVSFSTPEPPSMG